MTTEDAEKFEEIWEALELAIGALADIAFSADMRKASQCRAKAERAYQELAQFRDEQGR